MLRNVLICMLSLFPLASSLAETLPVRAGEHGEYSRLVIPSAPSGWRIATSDRKVEIALPGKEHGFELSDIIDKRKAHRVLSARVVDTADARSLVLTLTCDCAVRTSKGDKGSIVIDIFSDNSAPVTTAASQPSEQAPTEAMQKASAQGAENNNGTAISSSPESVRAARDRMIALLAEARHQGVVQLKIDEKQDQTYAEQQVEGPKAAVAPTQAAHTAPEFDPSELQNASVAAAASYEPKALAPHLEEKPAVNCVSTEVFHHPAEETPPLTYSAITAMRQQLEVSKDEQEKADIAKKLVLSYINIGFFEEANAIATTRIEAGDNNMAIAAALTYIATGSKQRANPITDKYKSCGPFFEMLHAAASTADQDAGFSISEKHANALSPLVRALRAPIAETLALRSLERGQNGTARAFYGIARDARGDDQTAALSILEKALGEAPERSDNLIEHLAQTAQTPGPLQTKALALLAKDYEERAEAAYDGLLDDLAQQSSADTEMSVSDARASFAGARALAASGRVNEGFDILKAAAQSAPSAAPAAKAVARAVIMNALMGDDEEKLKATQIYFKHQDFVTGDDDAELKLAVAQELSEYGAKHLVEDVLSEIPSKWSSRRTLIEANALMNKEAPESALTMLAQLQNSKEITDLKISANERLENNAQALAIINTAVRTGQSDKNMTHAAWRSQGWAQTLAAFEKSPVEEQTGAAAERVALSALNSRKASLPASAKKALSDNPDVLKALSHMFVKAPSVNVRAIDTLADFSKGVSKETQYMQKGLSDE